MRNNYTTIKVSKDTVRRLHKLVGELIKQRERRVSLEEAIIYLLKIEKKNNSSNSEARHSEINEERKEFLLLMDKKYFGAGPEDYKEYNYNDI